MARNNFASDNLALILRRNWVRHIQNNWNKLSYKFKAFSLALPHFYPIAACEREANQSLMLQMLGSVPERWRDSQPMGGKEPKLSSFWPFQSPSSNCIFTLLPSFIWQVLLSTFSIMRRPRISHAEYTKVSISHNPHASETLQSLERLRQIHK